MKCAAAFLVLFMVVLMAEPGEGYCGNINHGQLHGTHKMKCAAAFLVLFMVVLMAQPGEGFLGLLIHGAIHAGKFIHGLIHGQVYDVQELDKRSVDYRPGRPVFD
ncbi:pleurocidin-like peptide WF3 [Paralichthys olivaceus]|uniref:pleurocidin-like peptide WF3 n=1 Tax=Paralichthys olivaceus TaxID=8255 RepID=UPI0037526945